MRGRPSGVLPVVVIARGPIRDPGLAAAVGVLAIGRALDSREHTKSTERLVPGAKCGNGEMIPQLRQRVDGGPRARRLGGRAAGPC